MEKIRSNRDPRAIKFKEYFVKKYGKGVRLTAMSVSDKMYRVTVHKIASVQDGIVDYESVGVETGKLEDIMDELPHGSDIDYSELEEENDE